MGYAFISYTSSDKTFADTLRQILIDSGIQTFMAPYDMLTGPQYAGQLTKAIRESACVVLLLSKSAQESDHVDGEVQIAKGQKRPIVTIQIDEAPLNDNFTYYLQNKHITLLQEITPELLESRHIFDSIRGYIQESAEDVPPKQVQSNLCPTPTKGRVDPVAYLEVLWQKHHKGIIRDQPSSNIRELIDFFVLPDILSDGGACLKSPMFDFDKYLYITAGSGFGKTTLLQMSLLVNVIEPLIDGNSGMISTNSRSKCDAYRQIRHALFGEDAPVYFPVFIHAKASNDSDWVSMLDLAEGKTVAGFRDMVDEAHRAGTLFFLIDSIDEVERGEKVQKFLNSIQAHLQKDYPNARAIFTSRFMGKDPLTVDHVSVHVAELSDEAVHKITESILSSQYTAKILERFEENAYLMALVRNPFALLISLNTKGTLDLHKLLESIVTAVIERRWDKTNYDISTDDIMLLLGHLACNFVFKGIEAVSFNELRRFFQTATNELKKYGIEINIPKESMERFLRMLSCQSGILNIRNSNHVENYVFQDPLVMCWLAAHYISEVLTAPDNEDVAYRCGESCLWSNAAWIDAFIRGLTGRFYRLSENAVNTMVLALVLREDCDYQASILYYMLFKDATGVDAGEKTGIAAGYKNILCDTFGTNGITNNGSNHRRMILSALERHETGSLLD